MSMPKVTIVGGLILCLCCAAGVAGALSHDKSPKTALIPLAIGLLLIACGGVAFQNERLRKHLMHAAAMLALVAALGALVPIVIRTAKGTLADTSALGLVSIFGMFVTGVVLEILYVRSFIAARRARLAA
jgi:hypothetical protein